MRQVRGAIRRSQAAEVAIRQPAHPHQPAVVAHPRADGGEGIDQLVARFDLENDEALAELERRLRLIGVLRALEDRGFEIGEDVEIAGIVFELDAE